MSRKKFSLQLLEIAVYDSESRMGSEIEDNDAPREQRISQQALGSVLGVKAIGPCRHRRHQRSPIDVISHFQITGSGCTDNFQLTPPGLRTGMSRGIFRSRLTR